MFEHIGRLFADFGGFFLGMIHFGSTAGGGAATQVVHTLDCIAFIHH